MKKRIVAIIALVLLIAVSLSACNAITLNEQRRGERVVAEITYTTDNNTKLTREITRFQLLQTANQTLNQYYQYYGSLPEDLDLQEFFDDTLEQLCQFQLTVMYALDYLAKQKANALNDLNEWDGKPYSVSTSRSTQIVADRTSYDSGIVELDDVTAPKNGKDIYKEALYGVNSLVSLAEFDKAIKNANQQYETLFAQELATAEAEAKSIASIDSETTDEDELAAVLTARPVKKDASTETFKYNDTAFKTVADLTKSYPADYKTFTKIDTATGTDLRNRKDAWKATEKALADNYVNYDYLLNETLDNILIYEFRRVLTTRNGYTTEELDAEIAKLFNETAENNKKSYKKIADFYTAMDGGYTGVYFRPTDAVSGGYYYVKNLLIKFGTSADKQVQALKNLIGTTDQKYYDDEDGAWFQRVLEELAAIGGGDEEGIFSNVSNIFYDPKDDTVLFYKLETFFKDADGKKLDEADLDTLKEELKLLKDELIVKPIFDYIKSDEVWNDEAKLVSLKASLKAYAKGKDDEDEAILAYLTDNYETDTNITAVTKLAAVAKAINQKIYDHILANYAADPALIFKIGAADTTRAYVVEGLSSNVLLSMYDGYMTGEESKGTTVLEKQRAVLLGFDAWFYALNDDAESSFNAEKDYFMYEDASFVTPFETFADALYAATGVGGIDSRVGNYRDGSGTTYVLTEYGIHIMIITYVPFEETQLGDLDGYYLDEQRLDHSQIMNYYLTEDYTLFDTLQATSKTAKDNNIYFLTQRILINMEKNSDKAAFKTYPKIYKDLTKKA
ncbi:MAG: hypothetical protein LBT20_07710 [Clostridiales bacterium]|jgi:hypothetical protein|nr:hypothetical protein [Clostridiales bacterium]